MIRRAKQVKFRMMAYGFTVSGKMAAVAVSEMIANFSIADPCHGKLMELHDWLLEFSSRSKKSGMAKGRPIFPNRKVRNFCKLELTYSVNRQLGEILN
jgi:hypothetical protein